MLVYAKNPNGIIHVDRYRIYGIHWGQDPIDLPYSLYETYKNVLVDATYREGYLSQLFKKPFPEMAFRYSELRYLPSEKLDKILKALDIDFDTKWPSKRKVENIKMVIRNVSPSV